MAYIYNAIFNDWLFLVGIHIDNIGFGFKRHNHPIHDVSFPPDGYNEMEDDDCQPVVSY